MKSSENPELGFSLARIRTRFCPFTGKYWSDKTRILGFLMISGGTEVN